MLFKVVLLIISIATVYCSKQQQRSTHFDKSQILEELKTQLKAAGVANLKGRVLELESTIKRQECSHLDYGEAPAGVQQAVRAWALEKTIHHVKSLKGVEVEISPLKGQGSSSEESYVKNEINKNTALLRKVFLKIHQLTLFNKAKVEKETGFFRSSKPSYKIVNDDDLETGDKKCLHQFVNHLNKEGKTLDEGVTKKLIEEKARIENELINCFIHLSKVNIEKKKANPKKK